MNMTFGKTGLIGTFFIVALLNGAIAKADADLPDKPGMYEQSGEHNNRGKWVKRSKWRKLRNRVAQLEETVFALQAALAAEETARISADNAHQAVIDTVDGNTVLDLDGLMSYDDSTMTVIFSGVNLQVVNGEGTTDTINGLGNIIVGYNKPGFNSDGDPDSDIKTCSDGQYFEQTDCEINDAVWANTHKTGSHYIVVGDRHNYAQYVGLLVGENNAIRAPYGSVSGGKRNQVINEFASITGGRDNIAEGNLSTITGGDKNRASASFAHVSAGQENKATNIMASVTGGTFNIASGHRSTVTGGEYNKATAWASSVSGGHGNIANGRSSSISGGLRNTAEGRNSSISGGLRNTAEGEASSILGGRNQAASVNEETIPMLP